MISFFDRSIQKWRKGQHPAYHTRWSHLLYWSFSFSLKKISDKRASMISSGNPHSATLCRAKLPCTQRWLLEVVGNVKLGHKESDWIVDLLVAQVFFNTGKHWVQNVVYMNNERNWSLFFLLLFLFCFYFYSLFVLFFFRIVNFMTKTLDNFQFQSLVRVSQFTIRSEFNFFCSFHRMRFWNIFPVRGLTKATSTTE